MDPGGDEKDERRAIGGFARAQALAPNARSDIARKAALARWSPEFLQASHEGPFRIGTAEIMAAVLPDGTRLLSQGTFLRAIGRSRTPKGGTGGASHVDGLPFFLQAEQLKSFISDDLRMSTAPILFRMRTGQKTVGYRAQLLPMVCEVYLKFRDSCLRTGGGVPRNFQHIVQACDMLMRGLAHVGIVALVDEATGYQEVRDRLALQAILDRYLRKELAAWAKTFPDEFYREIFRLRGWTWKGMSVNRPQCVAQYTKDIVYARLAPGVLRELEARNPPDERGRRKAKLFQWLSDDIGHPALQQHLYSVLGIMRASTSWATFMRLVDRAFPRCGDTMLLPFMAEEETGSP